jgi:hypothetical protein
MRIFESCVSSETIKYRTGSDKLVACVQIGFGPMLVKGDKYIGTIDYVGFNLGDDFLIRAIQVYDNEKLSEELTKEFTGKILITSELDDIQ